MLGFAMKSVEAGEAGRHLDHANDERVRHCQVSDPAVSWLTHRAMTSANVARGALIANEGCDWGRCRVVRRNLETEPVPAA
jgi:hypothetical protein